MAALTTTVSGACQSLEACRKIGCLPQRELFLAAAAPDLAHDHQAGMDPHPYGQRTPAPGSSRRLSVPMACTMPSPVRTARCASSSCAWG